ncbi:helix-turn-helix transcriptional regulator [Nesterenkonia suensis]
MMLETASPMSWNAHAHLCEHELLWPLDGPLHVAVEDDTVTALPGQGIWLPAGVIHEASVPRATRFGATYLRTDASTTPSATGLTTVRPALRELLIHMNQVHLGLDTLLRLQRACLDLMDPPERRRPTLALPQDPRLEPLVHGLLDDCADPRTLQEWAAQVKLSARTVARVLRAETGMSFTQWRRHLRIHEAQLLLASGESVTGAAWQVGFHSTSAFIAAFKEMTGRTPGSVASDRYATSGDPYEKTLL